MAQAGILTSQSLVGRDSRYPVGPSRCGTSALYYQADIRNPGTVSLRHQTEPAWPSPSRHLRSRAGIFTHAMSASLPSQADVSARLLCRVMSLPEPGHHRSIGSGRIVPGRIAPMPPRCQLASTSLRRPKTRPQRYSKQACRSMPR